MESPSKEFQRRIRLIEDNPDPQSAVRELVSLIHDGQTGGGRRACGCRMHCDGMTTICIWPCRQHWIEESTDLICALGVVGLVVFVFLILWMIF